MKQIKINFLRTKDSDPERYHYILNTLARHLQDANQNKRLYELFENQVWMNNRFEQSTSYIGYVNDVQIGLSAVSREIISKVEKNEYPVSYSLLFRYLLIISSIGTFSSQYSPELVARAIDTSLKSWTVERALNIASLSTSDYWKAMLYSSLLQTKKISESIRDQILRQLSPVLGSGHDGHSNDDLDLEHKLAVEEISIILEHIQQMDTLSFGGHCPRADAIEKAATHFEGKSYTDFVRVAMGIDDLYGRTQALVSISAYLDSRSQAQLLHICYESLVFWNPKNFVGGLDYYFTIRAIARLAPNMSYKEQQVLWDLANQYFGILRRYHHQVPSEVIPAAAALLRFRYGFQDVLEATNSIREGLFRNHVFEELARYLRDRHIKSYVKTPTTLGMLESLLRSVSDAYYVHLKRRILAILAPVLQGDTLITALEFAFAFDDYERIGEAIFRISTLITNDCKRLNGKKFMDIVLNIGDEEVRSKLEEKFEKSLSEPAIHQAQSEENRKQVIRDIIIDANQLTLTSRAETIDKFISQEFLDVGLTDITLTEIIDNLIEIATKWKWR